MNGVGDEIPGDINPDFAIWDVIEWIWEYPDFSDLRRIAGAIESQEYNPNFYPYCVCQKGKNVILQNYYYRIR